MSMLCLLTRVLYIRVNQSFLCAGLSRLLNPLRHNNYIMLRVTSLLVSNTERRNNMPAVRGVGKHWMLTIPQHLFTPYLPSGCCYIRGQLEQGESTGYLHWQLYVVFLTNQRLSAVTKQFGTGIHAELTRSAAARDYCWKDDTCVAGTRFELGSLPVRRNNGHDWAAIRQSAARGELESIPDDIFVRYHFQLSAISRMHIRPPAIVRRGIVLHGATGTGKSRSAWETHPDAYPKDPRTKWFDGYCGQSTIIIDEFRGDIDISHILRWLDRYPVIVEAKGRALPLLADTIIFTSNLHPRDWFKEIDFPTFEALLRRIKIFEFPTEINWNET